MLSKLKLWARNLPEKQWLFSSKSTKTQSNKRYLFILLLKMTCNMHKSRIALNLHFDFFLYSTRVDISGLWGKAKKLRNDDKVGKKKKFNTDSGCFIYSFKSQRYVTSRKKRRVNIISLFFIMQVEFSETWIVMNLRNNKASSTEKKIEREIENLSVAQEKWNFYDQLFTECYLILLICSFFVDAVWLWLNSSTVTKTRIYEEIFLLL